jgi:GNAT superfamily N-acetyltransferase
MEMHVKFWFATALFLACTSIQADALKSGAFERSADMDAIRGAREADVPAMEALAEKKRSQYETYQPIFHRQAKDASQKHSEFLKSLLSNKEAILLVSDSQGSIQGFIYANIVMAPPVYNPGGKVCMVDDFVVSKPEEWQSVGKALLETALARAKAQGAVLGNVVCGPTDLPKRALLESLGYSVASEWHVKKL